MDVASLAQLTSQKLGEQSLFYPEDEIIKAGLNPAIRLLCLVHPMLLNQRLTVTFDTTSPFMDLRSINPRIRTITRVVLGDITDNIPLSNTTTGEFRDLTLATIPTLATKRDWFKEVGRVDHYWRWGKHWLGLYRRPVAPTVVTLIFEATPTPFDVNVLDAVPEIAAVYHPLIAQCATDLLLLKEGIPTGQRGLERLINDLGLDQRKTA